MIFILNVKKQRFKKFTRQQLKETDIMNKGNYDYCYRGWTYAENNLNLLNPFQYCKIEFI